MKKFTLFVAAMALIGRVVAQEVDSTDEKKNCVCPHISGKDLLPRQGKFFVFWGYNTSAYTNSDIRFWGNGYDFKVQDIRAADDPVKLSADYVKPTLFTVPQFNVRAGYFLNDKTFIGLGYDHMKYTMDKQATRLTGYVKNGPNAGEYKQTEVMVGEEAESHNPGPSVIDNLQGGFVTNFEHCDGLNDITIEIGRVEQIWADKRKMHVLSFVGNVGLGGVFPDSDVDVLGQEPKHDMEANKKAYHLAGYSLSMGLGLQFDFAKRFFLQGRVKGGFINMPDINTTVDGGKASQQFHFAEVFGVLGYYFNVHLRRHCHGSCQRKDESYQ